MTTETNTSNAEVPTEPQTGAEHAPETKPAVRSRSSKGLLIVVALAALVMAYLIYTGINSRARASSDLERATSADAISTVTVTHAKLAAGVQEIEVPGNMQAFIDTPVWARTSGYLKAWYADIGAHVKAGQLLAEIESPETDQQLQQAREELSTSQANLKLAQITSDRYQNLFKTDSVSKQDVDNTVQDQAAKAATVKSAEANVRRLEQLVGYEKIYAPFDGVITARNIDTGALVDAGANTQGKELFHLASTSTLRVYVNVPEVYSRAAKPGVATYLTLAEYPGRWFPGKVVRNANAIDQASRTLLVEVDVPNPSGELLPGSYVSAHLRLPAKVQSLTVPANTLLFRSEGLRVAVVRNGRVALVPVIIGHDYGQDVELTSGIQSSDSIIVNPSDSIAEGQEVRVSEKGA
ncbi:MAG TPA: efflux RND transporter periplasmic adaptor subunit [Bryobacteraceae bacterium]|jgi:RND family efflux transporter MFP subunit|nr:efflux RND transporter periplasmic adaptor subunit [Bryobacteraceae bacterium]